MLIVPLLFISLSLLSSAYLLSYKAEYLRYALRRYDVFIHERYHKKSCDNLHVLYLSYDPHYLSNC